MIDKLIAGVVVVALILAGLWAWGAKRFAEGRAAERADYEAAAETQREIARGVNFKQRQKAQEVDDGLARRAKLAEASAYLARSELQRMRDETRARRDLPGAPACTAETERARTAERLLESCSGRYSEVAGTADTLADLLRGYQALTSSDTISPKE